MNKNNKILDLPYFKAPIEHTIQYPGARCESIKCSFCNRESKNNYSSSDSTTDNEIYGCIDCLLEKKFSISHETEIGNVVNGKVQRLENRLNLSKMLFDKNHTDEEIKEITERYKVGFNIKEIAPPKEFNKSALLEIGFSPHIATYQKSEYLCHCNDFMTYIGRWEPGDFNKNAVDGDGRKLWMRMVDGKTNSLWDRTLKDIKEYGDEWPQYEDSGWSGGAMVYVFKCRHCDKLRCYWDCD